jgi:hypothetical protein
MSKLRSFLLLHRAMALGAPMLGGALPCFANPDYEAAAYRRVDVVMLGDSNQLFGASGWEDAFARLLGERYGIYATGLHSLGENAGDSASVGYQVGTFASRSQGGYAYEGAPRVVDELLPSSALCAPLNYARVGVGQTTMTSVGLVLRGGGYFNTQGVLRCLVATAQDDAPAFPFSMSLREERWPFATVAQQEFQSGVGSVGRLEWHELALPAGERAEQLSLRVPAFGSELRGPWTGVYARVIDATKPTGVSLHTLYGRGSQSLRSMAQALQEMGEPALGEFFAAIREQQGEAMPRIIIRVNSGVNDRSESRRSLGPAAVEGVGSADAFVDNAAAIVQAILHVWSARGWNPAELRFVFSVSHAIDIPNDPTLHAYGQAIKRLPAMFAPQLVSTVALESLIGADTMAANWYFAAWFDRIHLSSSGYLELAARELHAMRGCGTIDFNRDGLFPEDQDLIDFLSVLAGGECSTGTCSDIDFNNDGLFPSDDDLIAFLRVLAGGSCS